MERALKSLTSAPEQAIRGLTDWVGLTNFAAAIGNPWAAAACIAVIGVSVLAIVWRCSGVAWSCWRCYQDTTVELAKLGVIRPRYRFTRSKRQRK